MGEKSYYDGVENSPDEIYAWADANKTTPKTAAAVEVKARRILLRQKVIKEPMPTIIIDGTPIL